MSQPQRQAPSLPAGRPLRMREESKELLNTRGLGFQALLPVSIWNPNLHVEVWGTGHPQPTGPGVLEGAGKERRQAILADCCSQPTPPPETSPLSELLALDLRFINASVCACMCLHRKVRSLENTIMYIEKNKPQKHCISKKKVSCEKKQ